MSEHFGIEDIEYVARLARLELDDGSRAYFSSQLKEILEYVRKLNELDTSEVEPLAHILPLENVWRKDEVKESLSRKEVFLNAPKHKAGMFIVPKVIE